MRHKAIYATHPNVVSIDDTAGAFNANNQKVELDESLVQAKIAELEAAEPLRQLRIQRNQLLAQTDWRMTTDYPYADQSEWASYRTELRNLPQTANPTLDENGKLIVDWPTPPDNV